MNPDTNHNSPESRDAGSELDSVVRLLGADARAHAAAADAGLESRIAAATLPVVRAHQHAPGLRLVASDAEHPPRHRHADRLSISRPSWNSGLRVAAGIALLATVSAAILGSRTPVGPATVATNVSAVDDWDLLLGSDASSMTSGVSGTLANSSGTLLSESEAIGSRWSNEDASTDWTILDEGSL